MFAATPRPYPGCIRTSDTLLSVVRATRGRFRSLTLLLSLLCLPACGGESTPPTPPGPAFVDITREAGIEFVHTSGAYGKMYFPETMGGGCAFLDYDGDGDQDILLINGKYWRKRQVEAAGGQAVSALYRNDGSGHFEDVTKETGLDVVFYGLGTAVADYDGDGDPDILITGIGGNRMLRNEGGHFTDVTEASGLGGYEDDFNTSAGFFDADGDGDLDLFVCNYVLWSMRIDDTLAYRQQPIGRMYGPPTIWEGRQDHLYRNRGDGTFEDVSRASGIHVSNEHGRPLGKGLGVVFADLDRDGDLDVFVGNDTVRNFLFRNRGDGTFEEVGESSGVARSPDGSETGAMGVDVADLFDNSGLAVGVGNYEINSLYVSGKTPGVFMDQASQLGLGAPTRGVVTFGYFFFDYDLDGYLDVFQANGGTDMEGARLKAPAPYLQPNQLFRSTPTASGRRYALLSPAESGDVSTLCVGRGAAYADIDGDGDLDVLVAQIGRRPMLLRNETNSAHHWLRLRLVGRTPNRDAIGAWATLRAGGQVQRRQVMPARSYCSSVELPLTFGLGTRDQVEALSITWPDGVTQDVVVPGVDRLLIVRREP